MNNKDFIKELSLRCGYTQEMTQNIMRKVIGAMGDAFEEGNAVAWSGFGTFEVKKRIERTMVNPSTGQTMLVPPKLVLNFKPVAAIKEILKSQQLAVGNDEKGGKSNG